MSISRSMMRGLVMRSGAFSHEVEAIQNEYRRDCRASQRPFALRATSWHHLSDSYRSPRARLRKEWRSMTAANQPAYWIIVSSPDNFARSREIGFTMQGIKTRHRKKAE